MTLQKHARQFELDPTARGVVAVVGAFTGSLAHPQMDAAWATGFEMALDLVIASPAVMRRLALLIRQQRGDDGLAPTGETLTRLISGLLDRIPEGGTDGD